MEKNSIDKPDLKIENKQEAKSLSLEEMNTTFFKPVVNYGGVTFNFDFTDILKDTYDCKSFNEKADEIIADKISYLDYETMRNGNQREVLLAKELERKIVNSDAYLKDAKKIKEDENKDNEEKDLDNLTHSYIIKAKRCNQTIASLFRGIAKIPKITQQDLDSYVRLPENDVIHNTLGEKFCTEFIEFPDNEVDIENIKESYFISVLPDEFAKESYVRVSNRIATLPIVEDEEGKSEEEKSEEEKQDIFFKKRRLENFKSFLEGKFPYVKDGNKEESIEDAEVIVEKNEQEKLTPKSRLASAKDFLNSKIKKLSEFFPKKKKDDIPDVSTDTKVEDHISDTSLVDIKTVPSATNSVENKTKEETKNKRRLFAGLFGGPKKPKPFLEGGEVKSSEDGGKNVEPKHIDIGDVSEAGKLESKEIPKKKIESALARIGKKIENSAEWYNKLPPKTKFAIGAGLVVAGLAGAAFSSGVMLGAVATAKYAVRGVSAYGAGKGVEGMMNSQDGTSAEYSEKKKRVAKIATMLGVFALGSYSGDIFKSIGESFGDMFPHHSLQDFTDTAFKAPQNANVINHASMSHSAVSSVNVSPTLDTVTTTPATPNITAGAEISASNIPLPEHIIDVSSGDTLSEIMMDNIDDAHPKLSELSPEGKTNFIYNVLNQLTPDQLQEAGISSGDVNKIYSGESIDMNKLIEYSKDMTVNGESLLDRAEKL